MDALLSKEKYKNFNKIYYLLFNYIKRKKHLFMADKIKVNLINGFKKLKKLQGIKIFLNFIKLNKILGKENLEQ